MIDWLFLLMMIVPFVTGIAVLIWTIKRVEKGLLKISLLTVGASLTGFLVFVLLHNLVYGLFIHFFGTDFWNGGDEPFFFIIAIFICPLGFIVGTIGSIVLVVRRRLKG